MTKDLTSKDIHNPDFSLYFRQVQDHSTLLVGCRWDEYSASAIGRAVEDCNAQALNINVTDFDVDGFDLVVAVRVSHRNPDAIARSLTRYGFEVINVIAGSDDDADRMRARANEVLRYLEL